MCRRHNFQFSTEQNEGRIFVKFGEGMGGMNPQAQSQYYQNQYYGHQNQQQSYGQKPHGNHQQGAGMGQIEHEIEQMATKAARWFGPNLFRKMQQCCTVM